MQMLFSHYESIISYSIMRKEILNLLTKISAESQPPVINVEIDQYQLKILDKDSPKYRIDDVPHLKDILFSEAPKSSVLR